MVGFAQASTKESSLMESDESEAPVFEYRICWNAGSNISFKGATDWQPWDDDHATEDEVSDALEASSGQWSLALEEFVDAAGVEFWAEVRTVEP